MAFKNSSIREPAASRVYIALRRRILDLSLAPGEPLSELSVAAEFGLSRTPVREAFKRLEGDGLVDVVPQLGTFVSPIRRELVMDAQFARSALECSLVRVAAIIRSDHQLVQLDDNLRAQNRAADEGDFDRLYRLDDDMHQLLAIAAGRPNVWSLISDVKLHMDRARKLTLRPGHVPTLLLQHEAIVGAVRRRDPDDADQAMKIHLHFIVEHFDEFVGDAGSATSAGGAATARAATTDETAQAATVMRDGRE